MIASVQKEIAVAPSPLAAANGLKVICAWCTATIKDGDPARVSHGICEPCAEKYFPAAAARRAPQNFLPGDYRPRADAGYRSQSAAASAC